MERMAYSRLTPAVVWIRLCTKYGRYLPGCICGIAVTALRNIIRSSLFRRLFLRDGVSNRAKRKQLGAPRSSSKEIVNALFLFARHHL
jgi:hypothetical protein